MKDPERIKWMSGKTGIKTAGLGQPGEAIIIHNRPAGMGIQQAFMEMLRAGISHRTVTQHYANFWICRNRII